MPGLLISLEGIDGSGKSLQIKRISRYFHRKNLDCILVREPGGTDIGEQIRQVIIDSRNTGMECMAEALLYAAARAQLVKEIIRPALSTGTVVLCDRFLDSSLVYQGVARGLGMETVAAINQYALDGLEPDATFFLKLDPSQTRARMKNRRHQDRIEQEDSSFHWKAYEGYMSLLKRFPERIFAVDASRSVEQVSRQIYEMLDGLLSNKKVKVSEENAAPRK